jgi:hypothetical protein
MSVRQRTVNEPSTQVRLGKDRLGKVRLELGKDRDRERQELESARARKSPPRNCRK